MAATASEGSRVRRRRTLPVLACVLALLAVAAGLVVLDRLGLGTVPDTVGDDAGGAPLAVAPASADGVPVPRGLAEPLPPPEPVVPVAIRIPALGVDAPVVPISTEGDVLVPPAAPRVLGWWQEGAATGAPAGAALIAGHTVHTGGGALDDLETLLPGALVAVQGAGRDLAYRVATVRVLTKGLLAAQADQLFDQGGPPRLVLLTCEDWNGSGYDANVVVTAYQVDEPGDPLLRERVPVEPGQGSVPR